MMLGDELHTKNNENTCFLVESRQTTFYSHVLKVHYNNLQRKKNFLKNHQNQGHYTVPSTQIQTSNKHSNRKFLSWVGGVEGYDIQCHFQQYFNYIMAVSCIGGGNRNSQRKPLTCHKSLTNFIT
jgi:hypothetical protein